MEEPKEHIFVPATREQRLKGSMVIIVLEAATLELAVSLKNRERLTLLNSKDHRAQLAKAGRSDDLADLRPDILHQCLITLLDSPLNRAGRLAIFIRTRDGHFVDVSPHLTVPKSWIQFEALMVTFLARRSIKAQEKNVVLLRMIKNRLEEVLPVACRRIGLSVSGMPVDLSDFCSQFAAAKDPIVFFIGAVAKSDPTAAQTCKFVNEAISISPHALTAAICCGKICGEFEHLWHL